MKDIRKHGQLKFRRTKPVLVQLLFCCLVLSLTPKATARKLPQKAQKAKHNGTESTPEETKRVSNESYLREQRRESVSEEPYAQTFMEVTLDWTHCQIHRVNDDAPLEIILSGTIDSNAPEVLSMSTVFPTPGGTPKLYFIQDEAGRTGPMYGTDATTDWELSLNDGAFEPMTILPDNSIIYTFPPGQHIFQVRIRADVQKYQENGYYRLQLAQSFAPQL